MGRCAIIISTELRDDVHGSAAQALEVLLPLGHGVRVRHAGAPLVQPAARARVLLRRAHVHVRVVVVLPGQRVQRRPQRLPGVPVLLGAGPEPRPGGRSLRRVLGLGSGVPRSALRRGGSHRDGDGG
ncbi:unnamed protein product [Musa acuminata subsp. burmannicoides]